MDGGKITHLEQLWWRCGSQVYQERALDDCHDRLGDALDQLVDSDVLGKSKQGLGDGQRQRNPSPAGTAMLSQGLARSSREKLESGHVMSVGGKRCQEADTLPLWRSWAVRSGDMSLLSSISVITGI